jgi:hypothetical protein
MSYFSDLESSSVFRPPSSPPPLVPINSSENGRESVIRLRGANKSARFRPYTRLQRRETEITVFDMEKRWQDTNNIINKLKNQQIGKTAQRIEQEIQENRLRVEANNKRKADKIFAEMKEQRRKENIADMRTTLRQMEQVVIKQQSMMDCSRAILQRQVELLQFTIAEVKRQSALARDIDEEIKSSLDKINKLQQQ